MVKQIVTLVLLLAVLTTGCVTGPSGQAFDSPVGQWTEKYETESGSTQSGQLTIVDESRGYYGNSGRLQFYSNDADRTWQAYWILDSGKFPCTEERDGSPYWGKVIFEFNEQYNRYGGSWDVCGEGRKFAIEGYR